MSLTYLSPNFCDRDFQGFAAYCFSRSYDRDVFARTCNIISRLHDAGLHDSDISSLSCETICSLLRGQPYDTQRDRKLATGIRRYHEYLNLHCGYTAQKPVDLSTVSVVPAAPRCSISTKDRIISYIKEQAGRWISAAELSRRFNVYTQTLLYQLSGCSCVEISRPSDRRDTVRYRYVSSEAA